MSVFDEKRQDGTPQAVERLGLAKKVDLYLDRCQVDTPHELVSEVWRQVHQRRRKIRKVVDFGAGDARFSKSGKYGHYVGYEIDQTRCPLEEVPPRAEIVNACAFSEEINDADVCIGNPPYVRNQDLPEGWRQRAAEMIEARTGVTISGLANAWQYFFFLSLVSTKSDGLVALVIPFEWVSRPSSAALRKFIQKNGWIVNVYRLRDRTFDRVLTTSSITIIDKSSKSDKWSYYREVGPGDYKSMRSVTGGRRRPIGYERLNTVGVVAKRGLSPGTQDYLTLTEGERVRCGLWINTDVVPCVTSLRLLTANTIRLDKVAFKKDFIDAGRKCWLIRTDRTPSERLKAYLDSVPEAGRNSSTCNGREDWWRFTMPMVPSILMATGFRDRAPKVVVNTVNARAVGSVCGIYCESTQTAAIIAKALRSTDYRGRLVSHSNGLRKLEINQINFLLADISAK